MFHFFSFSCFLDVAGAGTSVLSVPEDASALNDASVLDVAVATLTAALAARFDIAELNVAVAVAALAALDVAALAALDVAATADMLDDEDAALNVAVATRVVAAAADAVNAADVPTIQSILSLA